ncbi:MAG: hypothetical protein VX777_10625 [Chlamydiota bacterium]|nr:hypothetical protein [Chlamydiota bacterium]
MNFTKTSLSYLFLLIFSLLAQNCFAYSTSKAYKKQYGYLKEYKAYPQDIVETDYYLIILVDAKHLDYSNSQSFLTTFTKHPTTGNKSCNVGHVWLYLKSPNSVIEGGHTGEFGVDCPKYVDGIIDLVNKEDRNPVRYLWETLNDGYFQEGSGGHYPTFAAKIDLSEEEYDAIKTFIDPRSYPYKSYSLTKRQCVSLVSQVLALVGVEIETDVTMKINQFAKIGGEKVKLWDNSSYSSITFSSPDIAEKSLISLVDTGKAEYALAWYQKKTKRNNAPIVETIKRFPERYLRHKSTF